MANPESTSIRYTSKLRRNSHMSLNRIFGDSRCTCFPVELELPHIAVTHSLTHKSLSTAPRPSPNRERCLVPDRKYRELYKGRAKVLLLKQPTPITRSLSSSGFLTTTTTEIQLSPELFVSEGRTLERLKEGVLR